MQIAIIASVFIGLANLLYTAISNRRKADSEVVARLFERLDDSDRRITTLESDIKHVPDKDGMHAIQNTVTELAGKVEVLTERLKPVTAMATRLQDALIEKVTS